MSVMVAAISTATYFLILSPASTHNKRPTTRNHARLEELGSAGSKQLAQGSLSRTEVKTHDMVVPDAESRQPQVASEPDSTRRVLELLLEDPRPELLNGFLPPGDIDIRELVRLAGYDLDSIDNGPERLESVAQDIKRSNAKVVGHLQSVVCHLMLVNLAKLDRGDFTPYLGGQANLDSPAPGTIQCLHPDATGEGHRLFVVTIARYPELKAQCDAAELEHRRRLMILRSALGPPP